MAFGKVYCFGPTFRAEKSKTRRHLTEFWMVEPEMAYADIEDIKRVAEELKRELPQLRSFCTLSPMPGFARWVRDGAVSDRVPEARSDNLAAARRTVAEACGPGLEKLSSATALKNLDDDTLDALTQLGAFYLAFHSTAAGGDPVARFHLDNGARLERLDPLGDLSPKGVKQSFALMVNYLYDLERIEAHHEQFIEGKVAHSRAIASLYAAGVIRDIELPHPIR